jgi:hypothetical protein
MVFDTLSYQKLSLQVCIFFSTLKDTGQYAKRSEENLAAGQMNKNEITHKLLTMFFRFVFKGTVPRRSVRVFYLGW